MTYRLTARLRQAQLPHAPWQRATNNVANPIIYKG
jgi:hypothetical protein